MAFSRPTLPELLERAISDIETRLPGADARVRRSNLNVLARMHAGAMHGLYGLLNWLALQLMPDTAEAEHLDRWASIWGITRKAATAAGGSITFTGTNGAVIPAGTTVQRADDVQYTTDADGTITGGSVLIAITAIEAGNDGNADAAVTVSLLSPISGVDADATVDANALTGGTDTETDDALRARLLSRIQQPPHGGADFDYVTWALEVAGVTRAWCYPLELGVGTVVVRIMMDGTYADGIPQAADVQAVQDHIDIYRPVTADVTVVAPVAVVLDITISGLSPDNATVRAAIEAELADMISRDAEPGGTILLSHIREAISIAAGEHDHAVTVPAADVTHTTSQIAVLGTVSYV